MKRILGFLALLLPAVHLAAQQGTGPSIRLFDGKTLRGWKQLTGTATYTVENGAIVGTTAAGSPNSFLVSERQFPGDFILELEARVDDSTMNSGVQFHSNFDPAGHDGLGKVYGYQFELDPSARAWSGGLYDEGRRDWLYPVSLHPQAQQAFRRGMYNRIRVECFGNRVCTWLNGIPVAYFVDTLTRNQGLIGLQVHAIGNGAAPGEKVYFRDIRIRTRDIHPTPFPPGVYVVDLVPNHLTEYEKKQGWKLLFDGHSSQGWVGAYKQAFPSQGWEISHGMITVLGSQGKESANGGDIVTREQFSAFDLSFQFRITPGANSGVKYFVTLDEHNEGSAIGLEYQVLDDERHPDAKLGRDGDRTLASLYDLIAANKQARFVHPPGEWNSGRIVVYPDNHVEHYLNGVKVLEYDRGSAAFRQLVSISKFKVWNHYGEAPQGHILLQDHGNEVSFRSIKIRRLR
ncbi:MAG TPA: DUF1080 domain-containing protein [Chitinophagaceae bacterium]|nr:DUF1080 domain-containing protein [Chitinophagaceae bacterium]